MLPRLLRPAECHCFTLSRPFSSTPPTPYKKTKGIPPRRPDWSRRPSPSILPPLPRAPLNSAPASLHPPPPRDEKGRPRWEIDRASLAAALPWDPTTSPSRWSPPRKLSREALSLVRLLHKSDPDLFSTPVLAERFRVSAEAIRRILKSRFELPGAEADRREAKRKEERIKEREASGEEEYAKRPWSGDAGAESREMSILSAQVRERMVPPIRGSARR